MGIDDTTIGLMERYGIHGHGASFGYPNYITRPNNRNVVNPSEPVFERLGVTLDLFDVGPLEGKHINILDLNDPLPDELVGKYDFLINPGTYEHVFNVGQALVNGYRIVKDGGLAFHHGSLDRPRLGYWQMTKNTWREFCALNGRLVHFEAQPRVYHAVTQNGDPREVTWPQENNVR